MSIEKLGKYIIRGTLGKGAMGLVYRAYDPFLEREVALKTIMDQVTMADPSAKERFYREAKAAAKLKHKHIVTIYDMGEEEGVPFIAMEIIDGIELSKLMKKNEMTLEQRLTIIRGVAEGLDFAHRGGVVHRDIKPANISVDTRDYSPKIMDFGIAKVAANDMTKTGMILGTINYMSPEQLKADKSLDGRSDLFAVGVILYELLLSKKPFTGDTITAVMYKIVHDQPEDLSALAEKYPAPIVSLVKRSLAKDRAERYQTGHELAEDTQRVIDALKSGKLDELELELAQGESTQGVDAALSAPAASATSMTNAPTQGGGRTSQSVGGRGGMTGQTQMKGGTGQHSGAIPGGTQSTMGGGGTQATMAGGGGPAQGTMSGATMAGTVSGTQFGTAGHAPSKAPWIIVALLVLAGGGFGLYKMMNKPTTPSTVSVQVFPWAELVSLTKNGKSVDSVALAGESTPFSFSVLPGEYELTYKVNGKAETLKFTASSGKAVTLIKSSTSVDTEKALNDLLTGAPAGSAPGAP